MFSFLYCRQYVLTQSGLQIEKMFVLKSLFFSPLEPQWFVLTQHKTQLVCRDEKKTTEEKWCHGVVQRSVFYLFVGRLCVSHTSVHVSAVFVRGAL